VGGLQQSLTVTASLGSACDAATSSSHIAQYK